MAGLDEDDEESFEKENENDSDVEFVASNLLDHEEQDRSPKAASKERDSPHFVSEKSPSVQEPTTQVALRPDIVQKHGFAVVVPPVQRRWEYRLFEENPAVRMIIGESENGEDVEFLVQFEDGDEDTVPFDELIELENGAAALAEFNNQSPFYSDTSNTATTSRSGRKPRKTNTVHATLSSDDELSTAIATKPQSRKHRLLRGLRSTTTGRPSQLRSYQSQLSLQSMSSETSSEASGRGRKRRQFPQKRDERATRAVARKKINYSDIPRLDDLESDETSDETQLGKRKRLSLGAPHASKSRRLLRGPTKRDNIPVEGGRRSDRNLRPLNYMREVGEDDIPEKVTTNGAPKYVGAKESFKDLPSSDEFKLRHCHTCDTCNGSDNSSERGRLVYCQGCTLSYHQKCIGQRNTREHLVTKVGDRDFVLQCRRCIGVSKQKDTTAPNQGLCQICHEPGPASAAFRDRKTNRQEHREREENDGEDPVADVPPGLINNSQNVLFRCMICYRAFHMHHLPSRGDAVSMAQDGDEEDIASDRFSRYCKTWSCSDCADAPAKVESLVAWRPSNVNKYVPGQTTDEVEEDAKEYLVKWEKTSYFKVQWMPGSWVWGVIAPLMRRAFERRNNSRNLPRMTLEDSVPEEYLRIDIVLDIEYTNVVKIHTEMVDKARIKEVKRALLKFKGLGYEDVVWDDPPRPEDTERWADFKAAYDDWVMRSYIHPPGVQGLNSHIAKIRSQVFAEKLKMEKQPSSLSGGEMMGYQLDGLNWLYYKWHQLQNAILADEMGLGKTIQVIGFLATLKQEHGCWPFLIVVPNSTCPNWRREIKQWAPGMQVVTYFGSAKAKNLSLKHELFPGGGKDLRCHVVVTSYDAAQEDDFRKTFRGIHWAALVVDEGQRLKNDRNILYSLLKTLKASFKLLLTGTPLQNNARELFNLLQFLDPTNNAQAMEEEYENLTEENVPRLHDKLRKVMLRRTKAEVLSFLPSMAQIILPVSMTVLQKKLYRSILAKNPELIKSILGGSKGSLKQNERTNLNNILSQLRKCLCHPFVYSREIEERSNDTRISHRNLVDASSKLKLLEIMLPKLQERGHRVLIFSQFLNMLDMVEDFLDGLGLFYQRLDGSMGSLQKQKRIDEFNAPDSPLFAFLLSTRAGGVGINLATADTVIILDPDYNPHQDIQALSRAHRIGQKKKVLVFQLMTRATAEEKIVQIGKKKMALDHILIEQMDAEDDVGFDLTSILRHGTEALFKDDDTQDIHYDSSSVDRLLDRSQIEDTQTGTDNSAESQFSFARVWENDKGVLKEGVGDDSEGDHQPDASVWERILKERERLAAEEAAARREDLGRGKRRRQAVDYSKQTDRDGPLESSPVPGKKHGNRLPEPESDTDFQIQEEESEGDADSGEDDGKQDAVQELDEAPLLRRSRGGVLGSQSSPVDVLRFKRAEVPPLPPHQLHGPKMVTGGTNEDASHGTCIACGKYHQVGYCPLKMAGVEFCGLCGLPHYGHSRNCPHVNSVTQLRAMNEAIKQSPEPLEVREAAKKKIVGIIGDLNQRRRRAADAQNALQPPPQPTGHHPNFDNHVRPQHVHGPGRPHLNESGPGKENRMPGVWPPP